MLSLLFSKFMFLIFQLLSISGRVCLAIYTETRTILTDNLLIIVGLISLRLSMTIHRTFDTRYVFVLLSIVLRNTITDALERRYSLP